MLRKGRHEMLQMWNGMMEVVVGRDRPGLLWTGEKGAGVRGGRGTYRGGGGEWVVKEDGYNVCLGGKKIVSVFHAVAGESGMSNVQCVCVRLSMST